MAADTYRALRPGGRVVVFGAVSIGSEGLPSILWHNMILPSILNVIPDRRAVLRYQMRDTKFHSSPEWYRDDLAQLFDLLARGEIKPILNRVPLSEASRAHELIDRAAVTGKVVLNCDS